jgi:hypothetical protein
MSVPPRRFLYLFVDGCGMGSADQALNPLAGFAAPLRTLLPRSPFVAGPGYETEGALLVQVEPLLTTPGLPQSATGQTALFTGVDPCPRVGRHISGFPTNTLAALLKKRSLLRTLVRRGFSVTGANAYSRDYFEKVRRERWLRFSATTLAIQAAGIPFRLEEELLSGRAVYHDLTHRLLVRRWPALRLLAPEEAAANLAGIVAEHDFTLFEYFLTDVAGHREDHEKQAAVVRELEAFFLELVTRLKALGATLFLTSDHGNIEDNTVRTHTRNRVPCLVLGGNRESRTPFRHETGPLESLYHRILAWFAYQPGNPSARS